MLIYILKFSACLAIFMVFYKLLLEKSSAHNFKRFYLLSALVLAFIIPSLTFVEYIDPVVANIETLEPISTFKITETLSQDKTTDYLSITLWSIYTLGACIFLLKFCLNLRKIILRINNNPKYKSERFINVLVKNLTIPHTFFSYIFLNKNKFEHGEIPKEVLLHEQTHAKQKHSIDVLILELLQIIFWFNPLIYLLKYDIKLNHEFLADRAVLNNGVQPAQYQSMLLAFSSKATHQQLTNAINYSSIKKRFTVMKTQTSKQTIWIRTMFLLPLLAILFYSFAQKKQVIKDTSEANTLMVSSSEGVSEDLMMEYTKFIEDFKKSNSINNNQYERIVSIYNLMSETQKTLVETYPKIPGIDLSKTKGKTPSLKTFESWKDPKQYSVWLDGVHIPNAKLNSYSPDDITYFIGSFVHKNARSKQFPQSYQFRLYTAKGFASTYQQSKVKEYKTLTENYSNAIKTYLKGPQTDNSELKMLKERCDRLYNSFSKDELKTHNILPAPPVPAQKKSKGATTKQVAEYNKLAKYYNDNLDRKHITIKMKDVERLKYLYGIMSDSQRENAQPFPNFPEPPPPPPAPVAIEVVEIEEVPPPPPISESATLEEKENYKKAIKNYKTKRQAKIKKLKNEKGELIEIVEIPDVVDIPPPPPPVSNNDEIKTGFTKINGQAHYFVSIDKTAKYYNRQGFEVNKSGKKISKNQVNASDIIPGQYITKVHSDGKIVSEFYDNIPNATKSNVDIPPPPPPPISTLDFAIDLANKNAKFYYENEEISSDKAIALLKQNPNLNLLAKHTKRKQQSVYISKAPIRPDNN
nr:M56 family metallopeptidase [uncultured Psychroserpens sp.]